ncbi:uncharacterized protein LOC132755664 [Ruditapes philippinarum]|uniref:uncharacterized protein LOC132755664 n=1 Tax=Ruditapes philippinarum TaxID=129788 RepID=UPI00295B8483|nr:uncharacterized protein LOC132755664 [Ruditapes philippinarum]
MLSTSLLNGSNGIFLGNTTGPNVKNHKIGILNDHLRKYFLLPKVDMSCNIRKAKIPSYVYEEIEKRQRQAGLKTFMARRGVDWISSTCSINAGNSRRSDQNMEKNKLRQLGISEKNATIGNS